MLVKLLCLACLLVTCAPTKFDRGAIKDVLHAIQKVLDFFQSDAKDINVDGLFGIRVAQGQLADILQNALLGSVSLPLMLRVEVTSLVAEMERISDLVIQNLGDTDYFKQFDPILGKAWNSSYSIRHVALDSVPQFVPEVLKKLVHNYDEPRGDRCFMDMFGRARFPKSQRPVPKCTIRPGCQQYLLEGTTNGYHLTHQLLYLNCGMQNCTKKIERLTGNSLEVLLRERCTRAYGEAVTLVDSGIPHSLRDYFMEDVTVCGILGFQEFFRPDWLRLIISFQSPSGCFAEQETRKKRHVGFFGSNAGMRKLLVERLMRGHCLSHASGLGLSSLGVYARHLLETFHIRQ
ncbi:UPF0764 protein C16orf89 homolog [Lineus longissimus]|uniref:UPF0764 protein C16orf89 homolog n=1 Tax=Lineus longissimus TaxID=88925 RepID=UPI00315DBFF7